MSIVQQAVIVFLPLGALLGFICHTRMLCVGLKLKWHPIVYKILITNQDVGKVEILDKETSDQVESTSLKRRHSSSPNVTNGLYEVCPHPLPP